MAYSDRMIQTVRETIARDGFEDPDIQQYAHAGDLDGVLERALELHQLGDESPDAGKAKFLILLIPQYQQGM